MKAKQSIIKLLESECHDFLNAKKGVPMPGYPNEKMHGFYIDVEDVAEMILKHKSKINEIISQHTVDNNLRRK